MDSIKRETTVNKGSSTERSVVESGRPGLRRVRSLNDASVKFQNVNSAVKMKKVVDNFEGTSLFFKKAAANRILKEKKVGNEDSFTFSNEVVTVFKDGKVVGGSTQTHGPNGGSGGGF
jgi:hypothetical protein